MLPPTLPRIHVWKGELIKHFSNMDIGLTGKYGAHAVSVLFFLSNNIIVNLLFTTELFVSFLSNCFIFFVRSKIYQILVTK
jgi:hypothetical protein